MGQFLRPWRSWLTRLLTLMVVGVLCMGCASDRNPSAVRRPVQPANGAAMLSGSKLGIDWLEAAPESKVAFCTEAISAFRGSAAQSYIISAGVQSLNPESFCYRLDQYFAIEENQAQRLESAAAIAPILFADTPNPFTS
ncbi:hypothetical protein [Leptolyngbya sp. FACHB-261]|uniref:hypothetical protein n=1 Tax=Leptolyngbya sp. FACHB-261 TaxID=2692806 RepID=UPI001685B4BC|nr:hypothetical protein [Leptolyngbya sp. FACHB-261]MBD2104502.1 hypothetical protein [Leptolyngbya sp. FACHB-261]